ncbi:MAG: KR domain-containing protein [Anaerolineae bacterium]|nr:KR domain-containing protein [Anaerolineae bacterium]
MTIEEDIETEGGAEPVAIIGMAGRFPGARNVQQFWNNLRQGVESITFFTREQLLQTNFDPQLLENPKFVSADGIIEDIDLFDAAFFHYTPREAELMDPQHRLFLECAWEALEEAGYDSEQYAGRVGVFASAGLSGYLLHNIMANAVMRRTTTSFQMLLSNDKDFVATKVSFKMNLRGPSMAVASLCSSSLVAVDLACRSLLTYQSDMALAGGVSLQVSRRDPFFYQEGGIGDSSGHCRAFDANARGTVSGSGLGIVVLKRLSDALADGDHVYALIRGFATNNDGSGKISYVAPRQEGHTEVVMEAQAMADVDPETITYVEAHGTGTELGDPIEVAALTQAFRARGAQAKQYCALGSVKTNIGHLVTAGGVASLIKTVLALQHQEIPPSLNFERPNPKIDFANSPFYVAAKLLPWKRRGDTPRRAGVSTLGIGGTNVHLVVEEAAAPEPSSPANPWQLLTFSARSETALAQQAANLREHLLQNPALNLADVAFTLHVGRRAFPYRRAVLCRDREDALAQLQTPADGRSWAQSQVAPDSPLTMICREAEALPPRLGAELYRAMPAFREAVDRCAEIAQSHLSQDIRPALWAAGGAPPALLPAAWFTLMYAAGQAWENWGVRPQKLLGQGIGEYVTACMAGVLSLGDALALALARGRMRSGAATVESFAAQVRQFSLGEPHVTLLAPDTAAPLPSGEATNAGYWLRSLGRPDVGGAPVATLAAPGVILLNLGPAPLPGVAATAYVDTWPQAATADGEMAALLAALGQVWASGVGVSWVRFHGAERRRRLTLPTYPFERRRYWIEPDAPVTADSAAASAAQADLPTTKKPDPAEWFYRPVWKTAQQLPAARYSGGELWLLFLDEIGAGEVLATQLREAGQPVITVAAGESFATPEPGAYQINPARRADYVALFEALRAAGQSPAHVVHLWGLTAEPVSDWSLAQTRGWLGLVWLAQLWPDERPLRLSVVANGMSAVESTDAPDPFKATLRGLCQVISQEYARVICRSIDVSLPPVAELPGWAAWTLMPELLAAPESLGIAYRGRRRWQRVFEALALPEAMPAHVWRPTGIYLLGGGLTETTFALLTATQAQWAILEDAGFPDEGQWANHLAQNAPETPVAQETRWLRELRAQGIQFEVVRAPQDDAAALRGQVTQLAARHGRLNGVIYSGGAPVPWGLLRDITGAPDNAPPLLPALPLRRFQVLDEALAGLPVDFCVVFSSLVTVLGGLGQAQASAAGAMIETASENGRANWQRIAWEAWEGDRAHRGATLAARVGALALAQTEGVTAFERIAQHAAGADVIVSTADLAARLARWSQPEAPETAPLILHPRPALAVPYAAPQSTMEKTIVQIWQRTLGIEQIGLDDNFFDLGGDSLIAVDTLARLEKTLQKKISAASLYETPTIRALAVLLGEDEDAVAQQRASELEARKQELARRNLQLRRRRTE